MKRNLTLIALLSPTFAFAQSSSSQTLFGGLFALLIIVLIFLALREVVMWYWKINAIIENQEKLLKSHKETNNLLSEQLSVMKGYYKPDGLDTNDQQKPV